MSTQTERALGLDGRTLGFLLGLFFAAVLLWDTPVVYPVKVFVVVLHELSHGLMAVATGGEIVKIEISERIGGVCTTRGGVRLLISSAGYLGSILWGGLILVVAVKTRWDNAMAIVIGVLLLVIDALYIRNLFGFVFTALFGAGLIVAARFASNAVMDVVMRFLGMTSCLYVVLDIKSDLIDRTDIGSDADAIAAQLGVPGLSIVIGVVWCAIALAAFVFFLWLARGGEVSPETRSAS